MEGFCVDTLVHDFFCALLSANIGPEVQMDVRGVQFVFLADVIADFIHYPRPQELQLLGDTSNRCRRHQSRTYGLLCQGTPLELLAATSSKVSSYRFGEFCTSSGCRT
ncbi:hypothetical protein CJ030_MR8G004400 [Morella rubra]|uniref:Uncharacterized protein n=1 Tax=Morella rubra TaxID=262757 RepID=A0A6A1URI9_9ROSI|nr:hypothetical protein CJ030_MR8G004400 [Morella rubra]